MSSTMTKPTGTTKNDSPKVATRAQTVREATTSALREHVVETRREAPDSAIDVSMGSPLREAMEHGVVRESSDDDTYVIPYDGYTVRYSQKQIDYMNGDLDEARARGEYPGTTTPAFNVRAVVDDHNRYVAIQKLRQKVHPSKWNQTKEIVQALIEAKQFIEQRDEDISQMAEDQRVRTMVNNLMEGVEQESRIYSTVKHAVGTALKENNDVDAATKVGKDVIKACKVATDAVNNMAKENKHGVNDSNVEIVLEEVYKTIDFAVGQTIGDHAKQMSGNLSRVDGQFDRVEGQFNRVEGQYKRVDGQIAHLNAIGQHVNAIDGHVHSFGNNLSAMSTLLNSTNGNITGMTTQIALLQTIVNMLPQMIEDILRQHLAENLQTGLGPLVAVLQAHGISLGIAAAQKKTIKSFFKGIVRRFRKDSA
ncbi:hypothetical protein ABKA04_002549 [Annulohypoxylon sp. FPYF3050]